MVGTYPGNCSTPVKTCQQMGLVGIWPICINLGGTTTADPGDDGNMGDDGTGGPGGPGNPNGPGGPNGSSTCNNPSDTDCGGIPNSSDSDVDGDEIPNAEDGDVDGDEIPNAEDGDVDGDGIPNLVDSTPNGIGTIYDYDGSGIPNHLDTDMDGNGIPNQCDADTDGDGIPNSIDTDDDNDRLPDIYDPTPTGLSSGTNCKVLGIGDTAYPTGDDIVRHHEGIEHVFIRRLIKSVNLQQRYFFFGTNLLQFAYDVSHSLSKAFGYIDVNGREIRVSQPDVSAYSLNISGNKLYVYEYYKNKIIDIRIIRDDVRIFKTKNPYEYYFKKTF